MSAGAQRLKDLLVAIRDANGAAIEVGKDFPTPRELAPLVWAALVDATSNGAEFGNDFAAALAGWVSPMAGGSVLGDVGGKEWT